MVSHLWGFCIKKSNHLFYFHEAYDVSASCTCLNSTITVTQTSSRITPLIIYPLA